MFTVQQIAEKLDVKENTVYKWIRDGKLKVNRLGTGPRARVRITQEQLDSFLQG